MVRAHGPLAGPGAAGQGVLAEAEGAEVYEIDGIGEGPFTIKSYCPDRFTLALDFPAMKSISAGVKIEEKEDEAEEG